MGQDWVLELEFGLSEQQILAAIEQHAKKTSRSLSAIIVEPIQGRAGVIEADFEWLASLRSICQSQEALLIYDEVFTGLARSGYWTTAEVAPCDLLCLGKALGGGLPLSALVGTEEAMRAWPENSGEAKHTGTFFGHPLSCRMAERTLTYMYDNELHVVSMSKGELLRELIEKQLEKLPVYSGMRGRALMQGIVFTRSGLGVAMMDKLRAKGVIALVSGREGHVLSLTPAINIPEEQLEQAAQIIIQAANELSY